MPPDPGANGEHQDKKRDFDDDRVAYTRGRVDRSVKLLHFFRGDHTSFDKALYNRPDALMNDDLGQDQYWQRNQKSYMRLDIAEKGKLCSAHKVGLRQGQDCQRKPA